MNKAALIGSLLVLLYSPQLFGSGNEAPESPVLVAPQDGLSNAPTSPLLEVSVLDADDPELTVSFFGRRDGQPVSRFSLVILPDTQEYAAHYPEIFHDQTQWIANSRDLLNIEFVLHMGDIVNSPVDEQQWIRADSAMSLLDGVVPYAVTPGNHDMSPGRVTLFYDEYFPASRFADEPWFGSSYRNNRNSYQLFSAAGMDFLLLNLEYDVPDDVLSWADSVLALFEDRRAVVVTHAYLTPAGNLTSAPWDEGGNSGQDIWEKLIQDNCNVFLVLSGHLNGEGRRTSINTCGNPVHQLIQNYQFRPNGGDGFLRLLRFDASEDRIDVYSYSPTLSQFENDDDSSFSLSYDMTFHPLGFRRDVPSGSSSSTPWAALAPQTSHEWYVSVFDGESRTSGPVWHFQTQPCVPVGADDNCDGVDDDCDGNTDEDFVPFPVECGVGLCQGSQGSMLCHPGGVADSTCNPYEGARPETCDGQDEDCDGTVDPPLPNNGLELFMDTASRLTWSSWSVATEYDVVRGRLEVLSGNGGDFGAASESCVITGTADLTVVDEEMPPVGEAFWYLLRGRNCAGPGTYDSTGTGQFVSRDPSFASAPDLCQ